jgi:hypothetical protein
LQDRVNEGAIRPRPDWTLDSEADTAVRLLALVFPGDQGSLRAQIDLLEGSYSRGMTA